MFCCIGKNTANSGLTFETFFCKKLLNFCQLYLFTRQTTTLGKSLIFLKFQYFKSERSVKSQIKSKVLHLLCWSVSQITFDPGRECKKAMCKQDFVSCMMCWSTGGPERFGSSPEPCSSRASKIPKKNHPGSIGQRAKPPRAALAW